MNYVMDVFLLVYMYLEVGNHIVSMHVTFLTLHNYQLPSETHDNNVSDKHVLIVIYM